MTPSLARPLHTEHAGAPEAPPMVFVHPNPMDGTAWMFQMAHLSTWFRCVAVDLPGYGRSPAASDELTMLDVARACWSAVDIPLNQPAVLVGCSVGAVVVQHMYHLQPERTAAVVLTGAGWSASKPHLQRHIDAFHREGLAYRHAYTLADFAQTFRTTPFARWLAELFVERNHLADLDTIVTMLRALQRPDPEWLSLELRVPALILAGSEDNAYPRARVLRERLPDAELITLEGAGHACNLERPWEFDRHLLAFLDRLGLR